MAKLVVRSFTFLILVSVLALPACSQRAEQEISPSPTPPPGVGAEADTDLPGSQQPAHGTGQQSQPPMCEADETQSEHWHARPAPSKDQQPLSQAGNTQSDGSVGTGKAPANRGPVLEKRKEVDATKAGESMRLHSAQRAIGTIGGMATGMANGPLMQFAPHAPWLVHPGFHTEQYDSIEEEGYVTVANRPLSTFSIDVDTASYSNVRRFLNDNSLPPAGAVRIEELLNYFSYDYPQPTGEHPFSVTTELASAPWNPDHKLALVGLRGRTLDEEHVPARNLVFLVDVSGSMMPANKLPLVQSALTSLAQRLRPQDHVAIVVYAGASGCVLEPTSGSSKQAILDALANLQAGGSTNGGEGIRLAYEMARRHFDREGINRVILATDGDFNVGTTSRSELVDLIERERDSGVFLTVLGVGMGNLKDATMEQLADRGNGNYAYLDSPAEARKVLVEEAGGTLVTIAKDVKIQVEFNPARAKAYRLIGYENRRLRDKDFNDDRKDAGEIGAGHSVTALYEIVPADAAGDGLPSVDPLRYQGPSDLTSAAESAELMTVKLRYKQPDGDTSKLLSVAVDDATREVADASANLRFAAAVATFGMTIRGSEDRGSASFDLAQSLARNALGTDPHAYRAEFLRLVAMARDLSSTQARATARE